MGRMEKETQLLDRFGLLGVASFLFWTVDGLIGVVGYRRMLGPEGTVSWWHALRASMVGAWMWVPLTVGIFWLARRSPLDPEHRGWRRSVGVHVAANVGVILFRAVLVYGGNRWIGWYPELPSFGEILYASVDHNLLLYWMLVGVAHALHFARRHRERALHASRLEAQLATARLGALEAQLRPHFLFNALHSLAELVHRDVDAADRMIVRLSELLRRTLAGDHAHEVPLREEIALLVPYIEIEQLRFGDRLSVTWDIAPEALDARVPHWILQPLVENALRHGLGRRAAPGHLCIAARAQAGRLMLEVRDDGSGPREGWEKTAGVGLANTRARLRELHGEDQRFTLAAANDRGAVASIDIPLARGLAERARSSGAPGATTSSGAPGATTPPGAPRATTPPGAPAPPATP
ncbi:sensor histidine kinase [Pendulispora albinea]|uniref:Histidine kinase n=1 Tax=Pendulispora albinea TaxID=2741071 RepID=A0ABZ2LTZ9_9BACT